ncbi:MAG: hypothetical protein HYY97_01235 [Rhodocyclales bacterium]|nr:hypothetical protein [Rhodocyclales bacterium]
MTRKFQYSVFPDDSVFAARCLNIEIASDGASEAAAVANLHEALEFDPGSSEFILNSVTTADT